MVGKIFIILAVLLLITTVGCSSGNTTNTSAPAADVRQVRQTEIAGKWAVKQVEIDLQSSISILLKLAEGDTVEGYYYLEKGNDINFQIFGKDLIYESRPVAVSGNITSDRFSFTASDAQGIAYTLKFSPAEEKNGKKTAATVFLEIIYPVTGEVFDPMGTK